jgi:methionyl-tRNA synthetase
MIAKNCGAKIPTPGAFSAEDRALLAAADGLYAKVRQAMDKQAIKQYLDAVWGVVADANRYFAAEQPWAKRRTDPQRAATILYVAAEVLRHVAILTQPVAPRSAAKLLNLLGQADDARAFTALGPEHRLQPGTSIPEPTGVFPRYVEPQENIVGMA